MTKHTLHLPLTALLAATLTACTTYDPYTREAQTARATTGAVIGGIAGAVVGIAAGDGSKERRRRALIGAGVGTLAGGSVGYYMDQQEAKLRRQLEGTGVSVTRHGDNITLNMPSNITFATDQADLRAEFPPVLDSVATVLEEFNQTLVEVAGHTDSTGAADYNRQLSERRANTVSQYLRARGVMDQRIITRGYGEDYPVASNETADGRALNRRVELTLVPLTER
jgi:outer membrane protein OmpA-like peptidoglycan-associated protein